MFRTRAFLLLAGIVFLSACSSQPQPEREIGEAFAGPASLKLRKEIDLRSAETVVVSHGDRLGILRRRRRFVKVRAANGAEGWTDTRQLLSSQQMGELNGLAESARALPSQGAATVYEWLNVHTEPNRQAPSFYRIKEGENVDIVAARTSPRVPFEPRAILPAQQPRPQPPQKPKEEPRIPRLPMPPAPGPPDNWLEISKYPSLPPDTQPKEDEEEAPKPAPADDWTLVRLKSGRAGWVLTSQLRVNIPDEVAQYSEGNRITSYFSMADVTDEGQVRHNWLWTTLSATRVPYQFDSFRYFIWNVRRHRYETAYIEKNLKGYYPVETGQVKMSAGKKVETFPSFSLILEEPDGTRYRKTYAFEYYRVVLTGKEKLETPLSSRDGKPDALVAAPPKNQPAQPRPGLWARLKRLFGR
jgi:hypothetical protein